MKIDGQIGEPGTAINAHPSAGFGELSAVLLDDGSVLALVRDPVTRIIYLCSAPDEATFAFTPNSLGADRAMFGLTAIDGNNAAIRAAIMRVPDGALWITVSVFRSTTGATGVVLDPDTDPLPVTASSCHVYRSADQGATWQHLSTVADSGTAGNGSAGAFSYGIHGADVVSFAGAWFAVMPFRQLVLGAWDSPTAVYRSVDSGVNWARVTTASTNRPRFALRQIPEMGGRIFWAWGSEPSGLRIARDLASVDGMTWAIISTTPAGSSPFSPGWWLGELSGGAHGRSFDVSGVSFGARRTTVTLPSRFPWPGDWLTQISTVAALSQHPFVHVGDRWIWEMAGRQVRPWNITRGGWHVGRIGF